MAASSKRLKSGDLAYGEAMRMLIYERWQAVWEEIPVAIEGTDPEGVHDVRVASRRLRAAMDVATGAFNSAWYKPLHRVAKEITGELGEVRDRDVQIEYLTAYRQRAQPGDQPGIDRLLARLEVERDNARRAMLDYLQQLQHRGVREETDRRFGERPIRRSNAEDLGE
jgi:CHAD domain-containing protein